MNAAVIVLTAFALDLCLGDPRWLPHPVRGLGRLITWWESPWRRAARVLGLRAAGAGFALTIIAAAGVTVWGSVRLAPLLAVYWTWTFLAVRDLDLHARAVVGCLEGADLEGARRALAQMVGRDTGNLEEPEILRAVLESVAESLNDGVAAPLFYFALGGPAAMGVYKAVNTLDSMVGHKDDRYREFGWAAARLDDILNAVPARLTAVLIWLAAALLRLDVARSIRAVWRDASRQPSPNAGYPEAALAGALGVRLGGLNFYGGVPSQKPWLADPVRPLARDAFRPARRILYTASAAMAAAVALAAGVR
jgi:adenosylcobinamide-phosphate synthase